MTTYLNVLFIGSLLLGLSGCASKPQESAMVQSDTTVMDSAPSVVTPADTTQNSLQLITGKVEEVTPGKDGYMAKVVTDTKEVYFATVSHANLRENASQYRAVKVGETLTLQGEVWKMGEETHVTVRELK